MAEPSSSATDATRLIRQESMLAQLRPIEDVVAAARKEVAKHRAAAIAAQQAGAADPVRQREAELAADGIEELVQRFDAMQSEVAGVSKVADAALEDLHQMLASLQDQIQAALTKFGSLPEERDN